MMESFSQFFNNNPWLNVIFLLLALFSIILSLVFYYRSKKEKLPTFSKRTINIIQHKIIKSNNLEVKYNNSIIENLSITEFAFWNSGRETIKGTDIAPNNPLIIKANKSIVIYGFEIMYSERVNNFSVIKQYEDRLKISFDFIDFNQGIKLKIYHSGNKSTDVEILGTIMGADTIKYGIEKDFLANKLDIIALPVNYLIKKKNWFLRSLGYILSIPLIVILLPLFVIVLPLDYLYEKIHNTKRKEFLLHD